MTQSVGSDSKCWSICLTCATPLSSIPHGTIWSLKYHLTELGGFTHYSAAPKHSRLHHGKWNLDYPASQGVATIKL